MSVRRVVADDLPELVAMVRELADYEKALDQCTLTIEQLRTALFGPAPALFGHVAEINGVAVGMALWFLNFSTWNGVHGIYLEDLYVRPHQRGHGAGRALLAALAGECIQQGYSRLQWQVLDWNTPSIAFYDRLGATPTPEWLGYRITGDALDRLADR